jgi:hypothetical protein
LVPIVNLFIWEEFAPTNVGGYRVFGDVPAGSIPPIPILLCASASLRLCVKYMATSQLATA